MLTLPKERPILFSGPMVRTILSGKKTQTRRLFKMPKGMGWYNCGSMTGEAGGHIHEVDGPGWWDISEMTCPHGREGDRLWVREAHSIPSHGDMKNQDTLARYQSVLYRADVGKHVIELGGNWTLRDDDCKWRPSIFMPRWASRITLEITAVRVERLQDINQVDAVAEGFTSIDDFGELWRDINGEASWKQDPWVWVLSFKRIEVPTC